MLSYVQGGVANIWKKNVIENLESKKLKYIIVGEFLIDLKNEFGEGDDETIKAVKLKKIEQGSRTICTGV